VVRLPHVAVEATVPEGCNDKLALAEGGIGPGVAVVAQGDQPVAIELRAPGRASGMVNQAVKRTLAEDAEDLEAFGARKREPNLDFEQFGKALKRRGKL
jgi:hypothetical protein